MKALIIETYTHFDTLDTLRKILTSIGFGVNEIRKFRDVIKIKSNEYGLIYINTIYGRQTFLYRWIIPWIQKSNVKIILGVHNSHVMFLDKLPEYEKRNILYYYKKHYSDFFEIKIPKTLVNIYIHLLNLAMKDIRKKINGIVVFGDYITCFEKPCVKVPTRITDEKSLSKRIKEIMKVSIPTFVIPGGVSDAMRKYSEILRALKKKKLNIRVKLLGRMMSNKLKYIINHDSYLKGVVSFYNEFVPENVFKSEMLSSHFALLIPRFTPPYGKYKATGGFHDAVSVGVPLIIPDNFSENISGPMIRYENINHLMEIIEELSYDITKGEYINRYLKPFLEYARNFTLTQVQSRFENFLVEIGVL